MIRCCWLNCDKDGVIDMAGERLCIKHADEMRKRYLQMALTDYSQRIADINKQYQGALDKMIAEWKAEKHLNP